MTREATRACRPRRSTLEGKRDERRHDGTEPDDLHDADGLPPRAWRQGRFEPAPQTPRCDEEVAHRAGEHDPCAGLAVLPRDDREHHDQQRIHLHVVARAERARHRRSPGEPAVYAVQRRRDERRCAAAVQATASVACLTDQRRHERHQHGAEGRDVVGRTEHIERMVLPHVSDRHARQLRQTPTRPSTHRPASSGRQAPRSTPPPRRSRRRAPARAGRDRTMGRGEAARTSRTSAETTLDCIAWRKA